MKMSLAATLERLKSEPALVRSVIIGLAAIGALVGLDNTVLTEEQINAGTALVIALSSVVGGLWVRKGVVPVEKAEAKESAAYTRAYNEGLYTPVPGTSIDVMTPPADTVLSTADELAGIGEA